MQLIEDLIRTHLCAAVETRFGAKIEAGVLQLQKTRKEFKGEITLVVFPLVKVAKRSPEETARILGEDLVGHLAEVSGFNVVKGFLNLEISDTYWLGFLQAMAANPNFGLAERGSKAQLMVEYSSPNTNKPLHLGHLRNNFLGFSVSRILEAAGHDVVKVQIINDRGIHICKSMVAWLRFGNGETPESTGLKGDKLVGKYYVAFDQHYKKEVAALLEQGLDEERAKREAPIMAEAREMLLKWEAKDDDVVALWKTMNSWVYKGFETTYLEMGVSFDTLYYESDTYLIGKDEVLRGLELGVFYRRDDGSIWVDLTADGLDEKLLLRGDGTAVYMTQDIGTAILRFREHPHLQGQIYTVGNEQEYHFKVLFLILEKLGFARSDKNFHLSYGMVELPEGKMKSREGTVVDADDLLAEMVATAREIAEAQGKIDGVDETEKEALCKTIGYGALKYYLLKVDPRKKMMFDPKESVDFFGNTSPFIQFNYVRTLALLRKAGEAGFAPGVDSGVVVSGEERELMRLLHGFPQVIAEAAAQYDPSHIANYTYELVRAYSSFYQSSPMLKETDELKRALRLEVTRQTGAVVERAMGLLGIGMPQRM